MRTRIATIGSLGSLALIVVALAGLTARPAPAVAEELLRIALLPIVVHSAEDPTYLRGGLADMMITRLDQAGVFSVVRVDDPERATTRLAEALATAKELGADLVLFGSFTRFGEGASLDVQCAAVADGAKARPLREIFVHSGNIGDVIPDLDELVGKVARFAVPGYQDPGSPPIELATPPSSALADLRRRVEQLEQGLEAVQSGTKDGDADVAAEGR